jgi:hypothetical protein
MSTAHTHSEKNKKNIKYLPISIVWEKKKILRTPSHIQEMVGGILRSLERLISFPNAQFYLDSSGFYYYYYMIIQRDR